MNSVTTTLKKRFNVIGSGKVDSTFSFTMNLQRGYENPALASGISFAKGNSTSLVPETLNSATVSLTYRKPFVRKIQLAFQKGLHGRQFKMVSGVQCNIRKNVNLCNLEIWKMMWSNGTRKTCEL